MDSQSTRVIAESVEEEPSVEEINEVAHDSEYEQMLMQLKMPPVSKRKNQPL